MLKQKIIEWWKQKCVNLLLCAISLFVMTVIVACAWYSVSYTNKCVNSDNALLEGSVSIDVCLSDSTSLKMYEDIRKIRETLERIGNDSIIVKVEKVKK